MMEHLMGCKTDAEITNMKDSGKCTEKDVTNLEDEVKLTKAEMRGVREENLRLKALLQQIGKDYKSLQMKFVDIFPQESKKDGTPVPTTSSNGGLEKNYDIINDDQEQDLVSLRLGTASSKKENINHVIINPSEGKLRIKSSGDEDDERVKLGLDHGLRFKENDGAMGFGNKNQIPGKNCNLVLRGKNVDGDDDEAGAGEIWPPSKMLKRQRSNEELNNVKRARVCVRARCDTPTMNDGCQWRKYGQKISKGNPCPRAYYRCTVSSSCPVRKQVQRCLEDMSILITTYEGTHNHPLPVSATAMASTTSAAASMLLSGSSTSQPPVVPQPPHYYIPNSSSPPFPTITLDLTTNPSTTSSGFSLYSSLSTTPQRLPATSLNFSTMNSNTMPTVWGRGGFSNYEPLPYNNYHSLQLVKPTQEENYKTAFEKFNHASSQQVLTETLTKAITSDPSFQSVIAAAISSMAGAAKNSQ